MYRQMNLLMFLSWPVELQFIRVHEKSVNSTAPQKTAISDSFRFLEVGGGMSSISNVLLMPCPQKWKQCSSTILYHWFYHPRFKMC